MLEPLRMYAHIPRLLTAYGRLEQAESKLDVLSPRQRALAELKAATTVRCEYCIDLGSQIARRWGITDEELLALADYQNAACFSDVDKLILQYATAISRTPVEVSDELFDGLRAHFDAAQPRAQELLTRVGVSVDTAGEPRWRFASALVHVHERRGIRVTVAPTPEASIVIVEARLIRGRLSLAMMIRACASGEGEIFGLSLDCGIPLAPAGYN